MSPLPPRVTRVVTAVSSLALALACAGIPSPDEPAPAAPTVEGGRGLAGVRQRGVLKVAADPDAAPFLSRDTSGGWQGFEYGILEALEDRIGTPVEIVPTPFPDLITRLNEGAADLAIGQISPSHRYPGVIWSVSYLQYSLCLVVPAESTVRWAADLTGKRVGLYDDPVTREIADSIIGPVYMPILFDDYGYFEKMVHGQLDAMLYDCPLARPEVAVYGGRLRIADDAINVATYNVAIPAEGDTLRKAVDGVIQRLGDEGRLAELEQRWLGAPPPKSGYKTGKGRVAVAAQGERLAPIAGRELGAEARWKELYDANRDVVGDDPDAVYAGMRLRVPEAP